MKKANETGSAHVIIIVVLAVALVGAVGTLFWQNIINKPTAQDSTTVVKQSASPSPSVAALKSYCTPLEKICFDYPNDWKYSYTKEAPDTGFVEVVTISDNNGKQWLALKTGMGGIGGSCGNDDGSYNKILTTHTSGISGAYLVNEAAKDYMVPAAYAISWIQYNGTQKNWTMDMGLNDSNVAPIVGKHDLCDLGLGVINGKNAKADGSTNAGAVEFGFNNGIDNAQTYPTEAAASAVLGTPEAVKAYGVLVSAHYQ